MEWIIEHLLIDGGMDGDIVLVVGGGGREHALTIGLVDSPSVSEVHVCPGNAGTSSIATNHSVSASDVDSIVSLAETIGADLVVVGPEAPLVSGLSDALRSRGIPSFGPDAVGARLEGSKEHAKEVMQSLGVPTADVIKVTELSQVEQSLDSFEPPWVVKRDVLAGGKGVTVTEDRIVASEALVEAINSDGFVLLEEFMPGEEASILVVMDESDFICLPASQDHKRVGEGDTGPNTGGMGAYAPAPVVTDAILSNVIDEIVRPMHQYLAGVSLYRGCLYVGLMIGPEGNSRVVEFNVRFGDPETQVTIPLISSDLNQLLGGAARGCLSDVSVTFHSGSAMTVVLASEGYPSSAKTGRPLLGSEQKKSNGDRFGFVHHAGTALSGEGIVSTGGRVCSATGVAPSLSEASEIAYSLISSMELEGSHYRRDIGFRVLEK